MKFLSSCIQLIFFIISLLCSSMTYAQNNEKKTFSKPRKTRQTKDQKSTSSVTASEMNALREAFRTPQKKKKVKEKKQSKGKDVSNSNRSKQSEIDALRRAFQNATSPQSTSLPNTPSLPAPSSLLGRNRQNSFQTFMNAMNPSISVLGIFSAGWTSLNGGGHCHADGVCHGEVGIFGHSHDPIRTGLNLQQLELALGAIADPFFSATVILSISEGPSISELEIEEAYLETLALPFGFKLKGGKFLSSVTRLGEKHLHDLDFATVNIPLMLAFGGEMSHYAMQATWLSPLPFFFQLGVEVSYGGSITFLVNDPSTPVVLGHMKAFFDINDSLRFFIGAGTGRGVWDRAEANAQELTRFIGTGYALLQWRPPQQGRFLSVKLMSEYYGTWNQCDPRKTNSSKPLYRQFCVRTDPQRIETQGLQGVIMKGLVQFAQQWQTGARFEWVEQREPSARRPTHRASAMISFIPTEFSRFRLEYNAANLFSDLEKSHAVWLQFQFSIGTHGAHRY